VQRIFRYIFISVFLLLILFGCGGLHYSQYDPEAKNFHPKRIGVLPVEAGAYEEARGAIDRVIPGVVIEKGWFSAVVAGEDMNRQLQANEELRKVVSDYTAKLKAVNFSDSQLSARIGEICSVDAFLVVSIDYWNYTTEDKDKVGKVGLGIKMIDAATGRVLWKAVHSRTEKYWLAKPELSDVARGLVKEMIAEMPH
jgi:hypothetical protein